MLRAYKYRLYPTAVQREKLDRSIGVCRLVYNLGLEVKKRAWQEARKRVTAIDLCYQLPELKQAYPWIGEVDSQALQAAVRKLDKAFDNFFRGAGYPKFKARRNGGSFQCPNNTRKVNWQKGTLTIPKISDIPVVLSRRFEGEIKTVTISKTPTGKYYASILVKCDIVLPQKPLIKEGTTIGIDIGIRSFVVTSDGRSFAPNRKLENNLKRLKSLSRRVSRKVKGSNNRKKAVLCLAILHERIHNQRINYCHQITTGLIRDNQAETFVIEDLAVVNMLGNRNLSRAIADVSFAEFRRQMQYKCEWYGKNLVIINRFAPSSKKCSSCGKINEQLTLGDREWVCECGAYHDRDENAAKNIKRYGLEQTLLKNNTGEGIPSEPVEQRRLRRAKKQESQRAN